MKLTLENISKTFVRAGETIPLFSGFHLELNPGQALVVMGPSGCGKTTLLRMIAGFEPPDSGEVIFGDRSLYALSDAERRTFRREKIGFVDQNSPTLPQLTALENVLLPTLGQKGNDDVAARSLLDHFGLGDRVDFFPSELSGGQQQRVVLARALLLCPDFLLLDEPTSALDARRETELLTLLKRLHEEKKTTLLLATHHRRVLDWFPEVVRLGKEA